MSERINDCPACDGTGEEEIRQFGYNEEPMDCDTRTVACSRCGGRGQEEAREPEVCGWCEDHQRSRRNGKVFVHSVRCRDCGKIWGS